MIKKHRILAAALLLSLLGASIVPAQSSLTIFVATDLHHLAPALTDYGTIFQALMDSGDGKLTEHSGELARDFLEEAHRQGADLIVLMGDLTFNGERASLEDLCAMLDGAQAAGTTVLVLPGNHDISSAFAFNYFGDSGRPVENISQRDFAQLCARFGPSQALYRDEHSFSYVYAATEKLWLLMLDANTDEAPIGTLGEGTFAWLENCLAAARDKGATVLSFTHQNLLPVNSLFATGFTIANCERVLALYDRYGVRYNFSGHSHIQHRSEEGGLTEIVTGPLCVSPLHYGVITVRDGEIAYEPRTLSRYQAEASERFSALTRRGLDELLDTLDLTPDERAHLSRFAATLNRAYFAGDEARIRAMQSDPAWPLWQRKAPDSFWVKYMQSIFPED